MGHSRVPLTITYRRPGAELPVFVAGNFPGSDWQPREMECTVDENGEQVFSSRVSADAGSKIQYRFRLGSGDHWELDEDAPAATDAAGNQCNVMDVPRVEEQTGPARAVDRRPGRMMQDEQSTAVKSTGTAGTASEALRSTETTPKPVPRAITGILNLSNPQSRTSTPGFVRTAAEVADSAALLDKEESEPEIPDEEAGRKGVRRMSSTPIPEVARTAAEVANTAEALDAEKAVPGLEFGSSDNDDLEPWDVEDPIQSYSQTPLFAHERVGMFEDDSAVGEYDLHQPDRHGRGSNDFDSYVADPDDPTLERFPSNWQDIADTVRKLEGGLNEDHTSVGGMPLSPAISPSTPRRLSCDPAADLVVSPVAVSPVASRRSRHLEVPRSPHGSISSDRSSALSLHSIPEAAEFGVEEENESYPGVSSWDAAREPRTDTARSCSSDESDGVVMRGSAAKAPLQATQKQEPRTLDPVSTQFARAC